jgi:hypothetical protein
MNTLVRHTPFAALAIFALASPAFAGGDAAARLGLEHEAELQSGEKMVVLEHGKTPESFRICVRQMPGDVRLKVVHDGDVTEVLDGTCQNITARHISVAPDSKLPPGDELGLKFRALKG